MKLILTLLLGFSSITFSLFAQDNLKVVLQMPLNIKPLSIGAVVSPDGKYIVSSTLEGGVYIWEVQTGRTLKSHYTHLARATNFAFHPTEPVVVSTSRIKNAGDPALVVWNYKTNTIRKFNEGQTQELVVFDPKGEFFITVGGSGEMKKWDYKTGKKLLEKSNSAAKLFINLDGTILLTSWNGKLKSFNTIDFEQTLEIPYSGILKELAFSDDNSSIMNLDNTTYETANLTDSIPKFQKYKSRSYLKSKANGSLIAPDGKVYSILNSSNDSQNKLATNYENLSKTEAELAKILDADLKKDGSKILITTDQGFVVVDLTTARINELPNIPQKKWRFGKYLDNGNMLLVSKEDVNYYNEDQKAIINSIKSDFPISDLSVSPDKKQALMVSAEYVGDLRFSSLELLISKNINSNSESRFDVFELNIKSGTIKAVAISDSIKKRWSATPCRVQYSNDGTLAGISVFSGNGMPIQMYNLKTWKQVYSSQKTMVTFRENGKQRIEHNVPKEKFLPMSYGFGISPKNNFAVSGTLLGYLHSFPMTNKNKYLYKIPNLSDRRTTAVYDVVFLASDSIFVVSEANGFIRIVNAKANRVIKEWKAHDDAIFKLLADPSGNTIITISHDKTLKIWDVKTGSLLSQILIYKNLKDFAFVTGDNFYRISKSGTQNIHFVEELKPYPFYQFDAIYNRPDLVLKKLKKANSRTEKLYELAWLKRVKKLGLDPKVLVQNKKSDGPIVKLTNDGTLKNSTTTSSFSLKGLATDDTYKLDRLFIEVNGVPFFGVRGKSFIDNASNSIEFSESISLSSGKNVIKVSVMNEKAVESLTEQFEVTYKPAKAVAPDLHVIAIGVSKFQQSEYNLTYADKDANDFVNLMKNAKGFGQVYVHSFTNEQATTENILAVRTELEKTKPDDQVVVFLASHGLLDDELDYYIAMNPIDFENPKNGGLRYDVLENLIDNIPARNKLMFIDACHSGEVDKDESQLVAANNTETSGVKSRGFLKKVANKEGIGLANSFELMKELFADLRRNNGAVVISSASGKEYAFESSEWQNGVFTYSLLEGLKSGNADLDKNKSVSVSELRDYVSKRVQELTNGKQNPTSRTENLVNDFRVW